MSKPKTVRRVVTGPGLRRRGDRAAREIGVPPPRRGKLFTGCEPDAARMDAHFRRLVS